jgi:Mg2+ and Co2+ transporter CorA
MTTLFNKNDINMNSFIFSSEKTKGDLQKIYIISLIDNEIIKNNPPFILFTKGYNIEVSNINIIIPSIKMDLVVYNKKTKKIYSNSNLIGLFNYEQDLYKIDKIINTIKKKIPDLTFNILDIVLKSLEKLRILLYDYELSINMIEDKTTKNIYNKVYKNITDTHQLIIIKANYLDMKTNRILTIITLITFPLLVLSGWFGANFPKKQMVFLNWKHSYIVVICIMIIFILICLYLFKDDITILI